METKAEQASFKTLLPLVLTQALSAFNNNQLRAALLMLVSFRGQGAFGLSPQATVGLSTIAIVAPFFLMSIPAGRIADKISKTSVVRFCKAAEVLIFILAAFALLRGDTELLLLALFLAGMEATLLGPAKLGLILELGSRHKVVGANAMMSATNVAAILFGMISGSLLALDPNGLRLIAVGGVIIAVAGLGASLKLAVAAPRAPGLRIGPVDFARDFGTAFSLLRHSSPIVLPTLGTAWFWFQGAVNTTIFPLYVSQSEGVSESFVTLLFISATSGACAGAFFCRMLEKQLLYARYLPVLVLLSIVMPSVDLSLVGHVENGASQVRVFIDILVLSVGTGFYFVPLTAAIQAFSPQSERARYIGIGNTLSGLAMILAGAVIAGASGTDVKSYQILTLNGILTGTIALLTLARALPSLQTFAARD